MSRNKYFAILPSNRAFYVPWSVRKEESKMHILWTLIIGLVIGAVAKLIMPGKDPGGFIVTILLGIAGSFIATWLGRALGLYPEGASAGFIMSVIGAILLLLIYRLVTKKKSTP
jgi:uncharacterized membrane protein YeaQ/YmgE (transglycosylase-associated protein family)